jgi:hypothetical protein
VPRKLVSTAARNGYFFTLDRVTGEHVVTSRYGATANWATGLRPSGAPNPNPLKEATIPGALVSPVEGGVTNWQPPAFSPDTGLFYTQENNGFNLLYLTDPDPRGSMGLGGKDRVAVGSADNAFSAIDYRSGETVWRHAWPPGGGGGSGVLATAGGVVFTGDGSGQSGGVRCGRRGPHLAHPHRQHHQRAGDLPARRAPVRAGRRRRSPLLVRPVLSRQADSPGASARTYRVRFDDSARYAAMSSIAASVTSV